MRIVLLGAPGSGKGTHASRLSLEKNWPNISTGDILRQNLKEETTIGKKAKDYMEKGKLVPDDLIIDLVKNRISLSDCRDGFILDGFPRTIIQAEKLDLLLKEKDIKLDKIIELKVSLDVIIDRMTGRLSCNSCGAIYHKKHMKPKVEGICDKCNNELSVRSDDNIDTIKKRYSVYESQTMPLIDYYNKNNNLVVVNGAQGSPDIVYNNIIEFL